MILSLKYSSTYLKSSMCYALCALLFALCASAQSDVNQFVWDQANSQMIHASNADDYLDAAGNYNRLLKNGVVNAPLLLNMGAALTMGGDTGNAIASFERAELYSGTTPEIKCGIIAALARQSKAGSIELPWYRTAFFWHFDISTQLRIIIALSGWTLLWTGILLYIIRKRNMTHPLQFLLTISETCMITGALVFMIFAASSLFSIMQEKQLRSRLSTAKFTNSAIQEMGDNS